MDRTIFPLVTAIAACYNHERYVVECLEGIRVQTYPNIQLIITDDCSQDHSVEMIEEWIKNHNVKCHFIKHLKNNGLTKTLNEALRFAEGKYVSLVSSDDVWLPDFIYKYIDLFEKQNDDVGIVYGNSFMMDESGNLLPYLKKKNKNFPEGYILKEFLANAFISTNAVLIRADCFQTVGFYDEDLYYEDLDMWTRILAVYKAVYIPEILAKYRVVQSSMSNSKNNMYIESMVKILTKLKESHPEYSKEIDNRFANISIYLYKARYPTRIKYLKLAYKNNKTKRCLFLLICAYLNISYQTCLNIINRYSALVNKGAN